MSAPNPKPCLFTGSEPTCRNTWTTLWLTDAQTASLTVWSKACSSSGSPIMGAQTQGMTRASRR
eukprot:905431-Lingulodinium_polyedra.AAC.1